MSATPLHMMTAWDLAISALSSYLYLARRYNTFLPTESQPIGRR
jgi:hypothetical protein